jgi:hypothetical protein
MAFLLKAKWPREFIERTELTGAEGSALSIGNTAFKLEIITQIVQCNAFFLIASSSRIKDRSGYRQRTISEH